MNVTSSPVGVRIKEIAFTGYPVTDMARARVFYETVLGLKPATVFEHEDKGWVEYEVGSGTLSIAKVGQDQWKASADGPNIAFEVEDFDAAMQAIRAAGVRCYMEPLEFPSCRFAIVADPDGNSVTIHQRTQAGVQPA